MKIAFFKAAHGSLLDRIIAWCSGRGRYSHVELVFSDGLFFSSAPFEGVRFKRVTPTPRHWTVYGLKITAEQEAKARAWCAEQVGKKYDWGGVLGFISTAKPEQGHFFCSEVCVTALQQVSVFCGIRADKVNPVTLQYIVEVAATDSFVHADLLMEASYSLVERKVP